MHRGTAAVYVVHIQAACCFPSPTPPNTHTKLHILLEFSIYHMCLPNELILLPLNSHSTLCHTCFADQPRFPLVHTAPTFRNYTIHASRSLFHCNVRVAMLATLLRYTLGWHNGEYQSNQTRKNKGMIVKPDLVDRNNTKR